MQDSKTCFKCGEHWPLTEFYKHSRMAYGHLNKCKNCTKADTKKNISKNAEYYREYERCRASLPNRVEARLKYSQTEEGRAAARKAKEKWSGENLVKRSAHFIVGNAVRDGKIIKPDFCQDCGKAGKIHGHHDDYSFPMDVRWLCPFCHTKWHKKNGSGING